MHRSEADALLAEITKTQNRLRGRLCGLVESWGMDARRESAMIQTIKATTYDNERDLKDALYKVVLEDATPS